MARRTKKKQRRTSKFQSQRDYHELTSAALETEEYAIKAIVGETGDLYQVVWEDSWIPKRWVNKQAITAWKERKADIQAALSSPLTQIDETDLLAEPYQGVLDEKHVEIEPSTRTSHELQTQTQIEQPKFKPRPQAFVISSSEDLSAEITQTDTHSSKNQVAQDSPSQTDRVNGYETFVTPHSTSIIKSQLPAEPYQDLSQRSAGHLVIDSQAQNSQFSSHPLLPALDTVDATNSQAYSVAASQSDSSQVIPESIDSMSQPAQTYEPTTAPSPELGSSLISHMLVPLKRRMSEEPSTTELVGTQIPPPDVSIQRSDGPPLPGNYIFLPMLPQQRQAYTTLPDTVFKGTDLSDVEQGQKLLPRLRAITVHPDLDNEEVYTQYDVDVDVHTEWDIAVSSKFAFLKLLFERPGHYGLVAKGFKMRALCKQFIIGLGLAGVDSKTRVSLLDDEDDVDLIIDLDGTSTPRRSRYLRVMIPYTVEHFEEGLTITGDTRTATLVHAVKEFEPLAGVAGTVEDAAVTVFAWLGGIPLPIVHKVNLETLQGSRPPPPKKVKIDWRGKYLAAEKRAGEWEIDFEKLLDQHEQLTTELSEANEAKALAEKVAQRQKDKAYKTQINVDKYKAETKDLKAELLRAETALLNHTVPSRARLESMRQALNKAEATAESAEKKLASARGDLDYIRGMYQTASNQAVSLAAENAELTKQLAAAESAADERRVQLRQMRLDDATQKILEENDYLQVVLESREKALKDRDEEIARLGRGRQTRSTSQARSPMRSPRRSPMRSPAPGERRLHPLRNGLV